MPKFRRFASLVIALALVACEKGGRSVPALDGGTPTPAADGGTPTAPGIPIGWVATLVGIEQGVSGQMTVTGPQTLRVTGFNYSGGGLGNVRFYGGRGNAYYKGFALGPQLAGRRWNNETVELTLPPGRTLADLDGMAVWCIAAGVSFGQGQFHAP